MDTGSGIGWRETYLLGSQASEETLISKFVTDINKIQVGNRDSAHAPRIARAFHAMIHVGTSNARFEVLPACRCSNRSSQHLARLIINAEKGQLF